MERLPSLCKIIRAAALGAVKDSIIQGLPSGDFQRILIKPNWVRHAEDLDFPISALVTSSTLIEASIDACLERYSSIQEITVGDVPLQSCDWRQLSAQAGIGFLAQKYEHLSKPRIQFLDLRREIAVVKRGYIRKVPNSGGGDPKGYREVILDEKSFLDEVSKEDASFRVSDYSPQRTVSSHRHGFHRYLIAGSTLDCDLFINLPKMKTHQKAGITGALKNLVGINGEKAFLVHFRTGQERGPGDEFPPSAPPLLVWQTRVREALQGRSRLLFSIMKPGWQVLKRLYRIETRGTARNLQRSNGRFYISGGAWHGNDTIWRMIFDMNKIVRYAPSEGGALCGTPQREYIAIMDATVAGEGNGPLQPLPVALGLILVANDPFLMDFCQARLMGFDWEKIPTLKKYREFGDDLFGAFDPSSVPITMLGREVRGVTNLPVLHPFRPAPGWKGHIELAEKDHELATVGLR